MMAEAYNIKNNRSDVKINEDKNKTGIKHTTQDAKIQKRMKQRLNTY